MATLDQHIEKGSSLLGLGGDIPSLESASWVIISTARKGLVPIGFADDRGMRRL